MNKKQTVEETTFYNRIPYTLGLIKGYIKDEESADKIIEAIELQFQSLQTEKEEILRGVKDLISFETVEEEEDFDRQLHTLAQKHGIDLTTKQE